LVDVAAPFADHHSFETPLGQVREKAGFRDATLQALVSYVSVSPVVDASGCQWRLTMSSTRAISAAVSLHAQLPVPDDRARMNDRDVTESESECQLHVVELRRQSVVYVLYLSPSPAPWQGSTVLHILIKMVYLHHVCSSQEYGHC
jgi:hypothetical protein